MSFGRPDVAEALILLRTERARVVAARAELDQALVELDRALEYAESPGRCAARREADRSPA